MFRKKLTREKAQKNFHEASLVLIDKSEEMVWRHLPLKVAAMQRVYLSKNSSLYTTGEKKQLGDYLNSTMLKFKYSAYNLRLM